MNFLSRPIFSLTAWMKAIRNQFLVLLLALIAGVATVPANTLILECYHNADFFQWTSDTGTVTFHINGGEGATQAVYDLNMGDGYWWPILYMPTDHLNRRITAYPSGELILSDYEYILARGKSFSYSIGFANVLHTNKFFYSFNGNLSHEGNILATWNHRVEILPYVWPGGEGDKPHYVGSEKGPIDIFVNVPGAKDPGDKPCKKNCSSCKGMPGYSVHPIFGTVTLDDTPLTYSPPVGPTISIGLSYNQTDRELPESGFDFSNFGPHWAYNWLAFIHDDADPNHSTYPVKRYSPGGGFEVYSDMDHETRTYKTEYRSRATLQRVDSPSLRYIRHLPDGSYEVYGEIVGTGTNRRVLLSYMTDAQGNTVTLHYDAQHRLASITDAAGKDTTFSYELSTDEFKITKATDPFGRTAQFGYDTSGRLQSITDMIGMTSTLTYSSDVNDPYGIKSMTTPYGTTSFDVSRSGYTNVVLITDPEGNQERWEYSTVIDAALLPSNEPVPSVPDFLVNTDELNKRNSFHWDKKAMKEIFSQGIAAGTQAFYAKAHISHWVNGPFGVTSILESEKAPLENRVWYNYPGQTNASSINRDMITEPSATVRVLDDGSAQITRATYNYQGNQLTSTDAAGRTTLYVYDTNGVDLLEVRQQTSPTTSDLLTSYSGYVNGQAQFVLDAAGQTNTTSYNLAGQVLTTTNAKGETITNTYFTTGTLAGRLQSVDGPLPGTSDTTQYTYDSKGRVRTVTDSEGYTTTTDYDDFDRVTKVTYPDNTYTQMTYNRLDPEWTRDRKGNWSRQWVNGIRQVILTQNPEGHLTNYLWCPCGSIRTLVDAEGNTTNWSFDTQGRVTAKIFADGSQTTYTYENATSRLKTVTDALEQTTTYTYTMDNRVASVAYSNVVHYTPSVSYAYDPVHSRMASVTDGEGTTTYSYNLYNGQVGAGKLASVDGPYANDTLTYTYDSLGRVTASALNGVTSTVAFDSLGRVTTTSNPLVTFTYSYVNATGRLAQVIYPNAQTTTFSYWGNTAAGGTGNGDERLKEIKHLDPTANVISKFNYEYSPDGQIVRWQQQPGTLPVRDYKYWYDGANRLVSAKLTASISGLPGAYHYVYDKVGNRLTEQIDQQPTKGTFNNLNQLKQIDGGSGQMLVSGSTSKDTSITVNGNPATVMNGTNFWAKVNVTGGTNTFTVSAKDFRNQTTSHVYQVVTAAAGSKSLTYDANGNLLDDGTHIYEWDAKNQLIAINYTGTTKRTEFVYNGAGCRVKILEKDNGSLTSFKSLIWAGDTIAEERDATNATTKRYYGQGFVDVTHSVNYFYSRDHLGSIREVTDTSGALHARYEFDPYGRTTKLSGDVDSDFLYTGHYFHTPSGLFLTLYRAYDPNTARWLSRDPIGERGGINLYGYVGNRPIRLNDPLGLSACDGYNPYLNSKCCASQKRVDDPYPKKAKAICENFLSMYQNSQAVNCVATCLTQEEAKAQKIESCQSRNSYRLTAHIICYVTCRFVPYKGLPLGAPDVGWNDLLPDAIKDAARLVGEGARNSNGTAFTR